MESAVAGLPIWAQFVMSLLATGGLVYTLTHKILENRQKNRRARDLVEQGTTDHLRNIGNQYLTNLLSQIALLRKEVKEYKVLVSDKDEKIEKLVKEVGTLSGQVTFLTGLMEKHQIKFDDGEIS
jgi:uncharacterized protein HemX